MQTKASFTNEITERERKNQALAFETAVESIVLLENDGVLPLSPCRVALLGAGAEFTIKGGSGSGEVNVRHEVNVLEGLEQAGFTITTASWLRRYRETWEAGKDAFIRTNRKKLLPPSTHVLAELMAAEYRYPSGDPVTDADIRDVDTCIYVLSRQSGEGHDRCDEAGSFRLDRTEEKHIRVCAERFSRFILVINTGAPIDLSPLDTISGINAIVYMNQLGMEGGNALAAVLTGNRTPSGKLAVSWAKRYSDYPCADAFGPYAPDPDHAVYREGIYVGYRYFDSFSVQPRYPFGYGKSYTAFSIEPKQISLAGPEAALTVTVTNTGKTHAGKEVVQLYVSCPQSGHAREYQRLAAFCKTSHLAPGESESVTLHFPLSVLSGFDASLAETVLDAGNYVLRVRSSSRETRPVAVLSLARRVILARHRHLCAPVKPVSELVCGVIPEEVLSKSLPVYRIDPAWFDAVEYSYATPVERFSEETKQHLKQFSAEDMVKFCAGTGLFGESRGFRVPGAVGHTTTDYLELGIPNRELCDGPAGLRIQRRSTIDKKGKIKAVDSSISLYEFLPKMVTRFLLGNPEKEQVVYQYVTGFPVAAAVAQTWNLPLVEEIGRAVSAEMTEFGVTWWLAPALNIVRNPLCGRNYEYYSEDPLLSGKFAAAITRGVQETPGNYVTIKHFAANNQEDNRYYVSSDLNEQALREIYLKGFEIVVREARPKSVMSAYNRLNGLYCANNRELCTDILRHEWAFDGLVMTDWLSTGEDRADEPGCLHAGVDLIMPGGKKVVKALQKAHEEGRLDDETLRRSCGRVLEQILSGNRE